FFFSSRRRHTRCYRDWSSDVCSSDLAALVVLILYGLLPILRTTIAGLRSIDPAIVEAGTAMGMTPRELLTQVELPLALPSIVAEIGRASCRERVERSEVAERESRSTH